MALIDYYKEIVSLRPDDWDVTLLSDDGVHPSYPAPYQHDFSDEGLRNSGYTLRNYLALSMYLKIRKIVETPLEVE